MEPLNLPAWYGRNLDALYDCLRDIREEMQIQLLQVPVLGKNPGRYAELLLKVLCAVSRENNAIHIKTQKSQKSIIFYCYLSTYQLLL